MKYEYYEGKSFSGEIEWSIWEVDEEKGIERRLAISDNLNSFGSDKLHEWRDYYRGKRLDIVYITEEEVFALML